MIGILAPEDGAKSARTRRLSHVHRMTGKEGDAGDADVPASSKEEYEDLLPESEVVQLFMGESGERRRGMVVLHSWTDALGCASVSLPEGVPAAAAVVEVGRALHFNNNSIGTIRNLFMCGSYSVWDSG